MVGEKILVGALLSGGAGVCEMAENGGFGLWQVEEEVGQVTGWHRWQEWGTRWQLWVWNRRRREAGDTGGGWRRRGKWRGVMGDEKGRHTGCWDPARSGTARSIISSSGESCGA